MKQFEYCQTVIPFEIQRAWFGAKPKSFRHPDEDNLHCIEPDSSLIGTASALIALHPDEATCLVIDAAVKHRKPFIIVPCCVFARVFPDRRTADGRAVNNYQDLLLFCREKDESIRQTQLSFDGKNVALWSTFSDTN